MCLPGENTMLMDIAGKQIKLIIKRRCAKLGNIALLLLPDFTQQSPNHYELSLKVTMKILPFPAKNHDFL